MKKKSFIILLLILVVCFPVFSYKDGHLHEKDIAALFFDYYYADDLLNSCKELQNCLCPALFITLDYSKGKEDKGQKSRNQLSEFGIYLQDNEMSLICTPGANSHEAYTHLGWDCDYTTAPFPFK